MDSKGDAVGAFQPRYCVHCGTQLRGMYCWKCGAGPFAYAAVSGAIARSTGGIAIAAVTVLVGVGTLLSPVLAMLLPLAYLVLVAWSIAKDGQSLRQGTSTQRPAESGPV